MSINTTMSPVSVSSSQVTAPQNTATQAVMINLQSQGAALQGASQALAATQTSIAAQQAILSNPKASSQEKAAAQTSLTALSADLEAQQSQIEQLKEMINNIMMQQLPSARVADKNQEDMKEQADSSEQKATDGQADAQKSAIDDQVQKIQAQIKKMVLGSDGKSTDAITSGADNVVDMIAALDQAVELKDGSSATASSASGTTGTSSNDAYMGSGGNASTAMSTTATVVSDIAQGQSAGDIESFLNSQGVNDPKINDLVKDAVKKAKDGRFATELAQGSFDDLLGSIDKAMKNMTGQSSGKTASKATANAGRATASVGGTSFQTAGTGTAQAASGVTGGGATANAGGTDATGGVVGPPAQSDPTSVLQTNESGQTNQDVMDAQPATGSAIDSMSANELLMYVMLLATGELNKEMRNMAKGLKAQTEQKAALREKGETLQKTYDAGTSSDTANSSLKGGASDATKANKQNLDDNQNQLDAIGDDMQQQQLRMQQIMQVQQQMMTAVSSVSKSLNDTSMSILRKIGG